MCHSCKIFQIRNLCSMSFRSTDCPSLDKRKQREERKHMRLFLVFAPWGYLSTGLDGQGSYISFSIFIGTSANLNCWCTSHRFPNNPCLYETTVWMNRAPNGDIDASRWSRPLGWWPKFGMGMVRSPIFRTRVKNLAYGLVQTSNKKKHLQVK